MAIRNASMKNQLANAYKSYAPNGALFSADPGTADSATGEISGGSPAYARKLMNFGTPSNGSMTSAATPFDVASGVTVTYFGVVSSTTAGTADVRDSTSVTSQNFSSQGTYTVTAGYVQT